MSTNTTLSTLSSLDLSTVHGGAEPPPSYNAQDVRNAATGANIGSRIGGVPGGVVGAGVGLMARNVGELGTGLWSLGSEYFRGRQLDAQRKAIIKP